MSETKNYQVDPFNLSLNLDALAEAIDLGALSQHLVNRGVFTKYELQSLPPQQTYSMLYALKTKASVLQSRFVQCLIESRQYRAAQILCPDFVPPPEQPINTEPPPQSTQTSGYTEPQYPPSREAPAYPPQPYGHMQQQYAPPISTSVPQNFVDALPIAAYLEREEEVEEEVEEEQWDYGKPEIVAHTLPDLTQVTVKKAVQRYGGSNSNYCYRMEAQPRGFALLFVNEFNGRVDMHRRGAAKDLDLLQDLFTQLGYTVLTYENTSKYSMTNILENFTHLEDLAWMDSCVVVISSHGEHDCIVCNDMQLLPVKDIKDMFNNEKCPGLSGKPKLFIIQACRGKIRDEGVAVYESMDSTPISFAFGQGPLYKPTVTDMVIAFSTSPGYVSNRTIIGSWYIYLLTDVFMKKAHNTRLEDMLMEVNRRMSQLKTQDGEKQAAETVWQGWHKRFFFNPGL